MNDATREVGGTLGVAVIGSVYASLYSSGFADSGVAQRLPTDVKATVEESVGAAMVAAGQIDAAGDSRTAQTLTDAADSAFLDGLAAGSYVAAGVTLLGAIVAAVFLPGHPKDTVPSGHSGADVSTAS
ncbi:hypothetical protein [Gordonia zhaorongruii]|uniref:hypothetical protein n=1 Tax=Gordonia zhaorongruii TaxID=2597659 RepID=UPI001F29A603|nr:hypothetical protein [Gordonia zhaorongruii]